MKIKDVISLEKDFHPVFDFKAETSGYWRRFITNEQFVEILDKVLTAVSSKEDKLRKSIWIQGANSIKQDFHMLLGKRKETCCLG